jgi:Holliday junction resolvase-like predicted endonuclease
VGAKKQRKLAQIAQVFLQERGLENAPARFDVVAFLGAELRHIPDAFRMG